MKLPPAATAFLVSGLLLALPAQATDVGVSVQISQPGVYGRVDIGRFPQPQLVVQQPVIVMRPVIVQAPPPPVYMWVPPGHRKNWRQYCGRYDACGVPVYFVQQRWYDDHVRPSQREHERDRKHERHDDRDDDRKGKSKDKHGQGKKGD